MARATLLRHLLQRLATVPETVELARATGLTLPQILYNAQMIRTWSLLLRNAQRQGSVTCVGCQHTCLARCCSVQFPVDAVAPSFVSCLRPVGAGVQHSEGTCQGCGWVDRQVLILGPPLQLSPAVAYLNFAVTKCLA